MHITEINLDNTLLLDAVTKGRARWGEAARRQRGGRRHWGSSRVSGAAGSCRAPRGGQSAAGRGPSKWSKLVLLAACGVLL
jgi:hypothetical protein